jgi:hypothetical protein
MCIITELIFLYCFLKLNKEYNNNFISNLHNKNTIYNKNKKNSQNKKNNKRKKTMYNKMYNKIYTNTHNKIKLYYE